MKTNMKYVSADNVYVQMIEILHWHEKTKKLKWEELDKITRKFLCTKDCLRVLKVRQIRKSQHLKKRTGISFAWIRCG